MSARTKPTHSSLYFWKLFSLLSPELLKHDWHIHPLFGRKWSETATEGKEWHCGISISCKQTCSKNVKVEELLKSRLYKHKSNFRLLGTFCLTFFPFIINTNVVSVAFSAFEQPNNFQRFEYVWQGGCFLYACLGLKFVLQVFVYFFSLVGVASQTQMMMNDGTNYLGWLADLLQGWGEKENGIGARKWI